VHSQTTYATCSPNAGKSRVPWLTGAVSWSYFSALQYLLGVRPEIEGLRIDPCIPRDWPGFEMQRDWRGMRITLRVKNSKRVCRGVLRCRVDGQELAGNLVPIDRLRDGSVVEVDLEG
jgi:cellobiose phosphorylase